MAIRRQQPAPPMLPRDPTANPRHCAEEPHSKASRTPPLGLAGMDQPGSLIEASVSSSLGKDAADSTRWDIGDVPDGESHLHGDALKFGAVTQQSGHGDHGVVRGVVAAVPGVASPMLFGQRHYAAHQPVLDPHLPAFQVAAMITGVLAHGG